MFSLIDRFGKEVCFLFNIKYILWNGRDNFRIQFIFGQTCVLKYLTKICSSKLIIISISEGIFPIIFELQGRVFLQMLIQIKVK